jgi:hypothetical protein
MLPLLPPRFLGGSGVRLESWDSGLTSQSADAVSGCPAIDLSAAIPDFQAPTGVPV